MQGFFKTEMTNIKQILFCTDPQVSVGIIVDDTNVDAGDDGSKIVKAGTPMYGSLLDRDTPFDIQTSSVDAKATATVGGTGGITAATVTAATFSTAVSGVNGTYEFVYRTSSEDPETAAWYIHIPGGYAPATLATYGIEVTGTAVAGDTITVVFTAAYETAPVGVLLHDVDVTAGSNNGTLLIFGFVNINRLDTTTAAALLAVESDLAGKVYVCAG